MLLSCVLAGCSKKEGETEDNSVSPITLNLRVISEKKVYTDKELEDAIKNGTVVKDSAEYNEIVKVQEAYKKVNEAITTITKSEFKVNLNIQYFTEEEYYTELDKAIEAMNADKQAAIEAEKKAKRDALKKGIPYVAPSTKKVGTEYYINPETGREEVKYPDVVEHQLDIFYLSGYDNYVKYIEDDVLAIIDSEIENNGKDLLTCISPALLDGVKYNGITYAVPNNNVLGEYTYMVINKEMFDKYKYNINDINDLRDLENFLGDVKSYESADDYVVFESDVHECMTQLVHYWNIAPETFDISNDFSLVGTVLRNELSRGEVLYDFESVLSKKTYKSILESVMGYKFEGYFGEAEEGKTSVVKFVKGSCMDKAKLEAEGNYVVISKYPEVSNDDIFDNMFCIATDSIDISKSMEVLSFLNTNSEIRNLLQYGIEGENYKITEEGLVRKNNDYMMDVSKTGNEFIAYPEEGMPLDIWEDYKEQNRAAIVNPLFGFSYKDSLPEYDEDGVNSGIDEELVKWLSEESKLFSQRINECNSSADLEKIISETQARPGYDENIWKLTYYAYDPLTEEPVDTKGHSPYRIYYQWATDNEYLPEGYLPLG